MARSRIIDYHLMQLHDGNTLKRLDAIEQLRLLGAVEALETLRHLCEHDSEFTVRSAAQKAGRHLFGLLVGKKDAS
jgi:HEAT repeat protein